MNVVEDFNCFFFHTTMNIISSIKPNNQIARLQTWDLDCKSPKTVDVWFFYQDFLASEELYKCSVPREKLIF